MQGTVRTDMRDRLVLGAEVPIARGGQDDLAAPGRRREARDLENLVRVVGTDGQLIRLVGCRLADILANAKRIA